MDIFYQTKYKDRNKFSNYLKPPWKCKVIWLFDINMNTHIYKAIDNTHQHSLNSPQSEVSKECSNHLISVVSLSRVSVAQGQTQSENIKFKKKSINKQFIGFKFHVILNSVMTFHTILPHPIRNMNHPLSTITRLYLLPSCYYRKKYSIYRIWYYSIFWGSLVAQLVQELTVAQIMNSLLSNSDLSSINQGKTTRPFRNNLNQIPYDYTYSGGDKQIQGIRSDTVPEELWIEVHDIVLEAVIKTIPKKKK